MSGHTIFFIGVLNAANETADYAEAYTPIDAIKRAIAFRLSHPAELNAWVWVSAPHGCSESDREQLNVMARMEGVNLQSRF